MYIITCIRAYVKPFYYCNKCTVELDDLIEELSQHVQPQQTWQEQQDSSNESWERIRPAVFEEEVIKLALRADNVSICIYFVMVIYVCACALC